MRSFRRRDVGARFAREGFAPASRTVVGLVLLGVLAALAGWWTAVAGESGGPRWSDGNVPPPAAEAEAAGTGSSDAAGQSSSGGQQAGSAPPYVQPFARRPDSTPRRPRPSPTAGIDLGDGSDGCDHAYGDPGVCVPWRFPDGVADKCEWLRARDYKPLKVNGRDRHGLDRNGDGIACGPGD
jgi:hypothetical protein